MAKRVKPGRVSVLIPLFNRSDFIGECIESVLNQSYEDIEIIVSDDGSTDGGDRIVESYEERGALKLLRHPGRVNKGQSAALNLALSKATGEFICVLDSDDIFMPGKIKHQVDYLSRNPEVGLVYCNGAGMDVTGRHLYWINYDNRPERNDPNEVLMDCYFHLPVNSMVRRAVYDRAGHFDESLRSGQDHDMLLRVAEITRIAHSSYDAFRYRRHGASISMQSTETRWRCGLTILNNAEKRYPYRRGARLQRRAVANFRLGQALIKNRRHRLEAFARMSYAACLDPGRALRVLVGREKITKV